MVRRQRHFCCYKLVLGGTARALLQRLAAALARERKNIKCCTDHTGFLQSPGGVLKNGDLSM